MIQNELHYGLSTYSDLVFFVCAFWHSIFIFVINYVPRQDKLVVYKILMLIYTWSPQKQPAPVLTGQMG